MPHLRQVRQKPPLPGLLGNMLKHRLLFGTLMSLFFVGVVILDAWLDGSLTACGTDDKPVQATVLCILIALLTVAGMVEMSKLAAKKGVTVFTSFAAISSILFATTWYWRQFAAVAPGIYLFCVSAFVLWGLFFIQYLRFGASGVLSNCGANYFSIIYLGLLSGFVIAMRIDFGVWPLLMFVFVVKGADIGAYTAGKLFGRHRFSPVISPGKTWEGMAGAIIAAGAVAVCFAGAFDIMSMRMAVIFGPVFAVIGQLGDLAESMLKRDAEQKDSTSAIPGFGGILDVVDSPLAAASFAYLFFVFAAR